MFIEMDINSLGAIAKFAGVAGLAIFAVTGVFREFIRAKFLPDLKKDDAYKLIRLALIFTFLIGIIGIISWVYIESNKTEPVKTNVKMANTEVFKRLIDAQSEIDLFLIELQHEKSSSENNFSKYSLKYEQLLSKLNSIKLTSSTLSFEDKTTYEIIKKYYNRFNSLKNFHKNNGKLKIIFLEEVRKQFDELSNMAQSIVNNGYYTHGYREDSLLDLIE